MRSDVQQTGRSAGFRGESIAIFQRTILQDGTTRLAHERRMFEFARLPRGELLVTIAGDDSGQVGNAAFDEIAAEFSRFGRPVVLFFDATKGGRAGVSRDEGLDGVVRGEPAEARPRFGARRSGCEADASDSIDRAASFANREPDPRDD